MKKIWVIVANSCESTIYRAENNNHLVPFKTFTHAEGHLPGRELLSDSQGRSSYPTMYGSDSMERKTSVRTKESMIFADEICQFLDDGLKHGEYEKLYLIAKAPFLGHLRDALTTNVTKAISAEVSKDLSQLRPEQIREYLPPAL